MEALAGFLVGYLLGSERGGPSRPAVRDALGSVARSGEIQSVVSGGIASARGLVTGLLQDRASVRRALGEIASSEEVRGVVSIGLSTAQGLAVDLLGRGRDLVLEQRGRGLRLVQ